MTGELATDTTAVVLHWPECLDPSCRADRVFLYEGIHGGEILHQLIDTLLEEHTPPAIGDTPAVTDVSVFWHLPNGRWEMDELRSERYAN